VGNPYPNVGGMDLMAQEALPNPVPASLDSVRGGEALFRRYCTTCHGPDGHGNGPVAGPPFGTGPFGVVIPIGGHFSLANAFSDGHITPPSPWAAGECRATSAFLSPGDGI
jgi:hypothetical protein